MTHYFDRNQDSRLVESVVKFKVNGVVFSFITGSGTFSRKGFDRASRLLFESAVIDDSDDVLDLGCGWGVVGALIKYFHLSVNLTMIDNNSRAVMLAKKNLSFLGLQAEVFVSDLFEKISDRVFDVILTNPPYAAGRSVCFSFIDESFNHLKKGGSLQLVARHQKGGAVLEDYMRGVFGNVRTIAKKGGFRVYMSVKQ